MRGEFVIGILVAVSFGLAAKPGSIAGGEAKGEGKARDGVKPATMYLGPFKLADFGDIAADLERDGGPDKETIAKALGECKYYLVDKFVYKDGKREFGDDNESPRILIEGTLSHELRDKDGRDFRFHVKGFTVAKDNIDLSVTPNTCRGGISVAIIVYRDLGDGARSKEQRNYFKNLQYDSDGGAGKAK